ncbi:hypothetical protein BC938DRAFT_470841 [Jimgerdemannia flammicorona]|uniref:Chromo domain-containing protein n=1 Tax=Jimgerdemannia flammicorona TaxID=994334 RepID=A0A433Q9C1_9FUNG|nr:hypothetical protein BC938DRAFT_470841 [Jimgerdemannia flammicorona]
MPPKPAKNSTPDNSKPKDIPPPPKTTSKLRKKPQPTTPSPESSRSRKASSPNKKEEELHPITAIHDKRVGPTGEIEYLVSWKPSNKESDTLPFVPDIIAEFERRRLQNLGAVSSPSTSTSSTSSKKATTRAQRSRSTSVTPLRESTSRAARRRHLSVESRSSADTSSNHPVKRVRVGSRTKSPQQTPSSTRARADTPATVPARTQRTPDLTLSASPSRGSPAPSLVTESEAALDRETVDETSIKPTSKRAPVLHVESSQPDDDDIPLSDRSDLSGEEDHQDQVKVKQEPELPTMPASNTKTSTTTSTPTALSRLANLPKIMLISDDEDDEDKNLSPVSRTSPKLQTGSLVSQRVRIVPPPKLDLLASSDSEEESGQEKEQGKKDRGSVESEKGNTGVDTVERDDGEKSVLMGLDGMGVNEMSMALDGAEEKDGGDSGMDVDVDRTMNDTSSVNTYATPMGLVQEQSKREELDPQVEPEQQLQVAVIEKEHSVEVNGKASDDARVDTNVGINIEANIDAIFEATAMAASGKAQDVVMETQLTPVQSGLEETNGMGQSPMSTSEELVRPEGEPIPLIPIQSIPIGNVTALAATSPSPLQPNVPTEVDSVVMATNSALPVPTPNGDESETESEDEESLMSRAAKARSKEKAKAIIPVVLPPSPTDCRDMWIPIRLTHLQQKLYQTILDNYRTQTERPHDEEESMSSSVPRSMSRQTLSRLLNCLNHPMMVEGEMVGTHDGRDDRRVSMWPNIGKLSFLNVMFSELIEMGASSKTIVILCHDMEMENNLQIFCERIHRFPTHRLSTVLDFAPRGEARNGIVVITSVTNGKGPKLQSNPIVDLVITYDAHIGPGDPVLRNFRAREHQQQIPIVWLVTAGTAEEAFMNALHNFANGTSRLAADLSTLELVNIIMPQRNGNSPISRIKWKKDDIELMMERGVAKAVGDFLKRDCYGKLRLWPDWIKKRLGFDGAVIGGSFDSRTSISEKGSNDKRPMDEEPGGMETFRVKSARLSRGQEASSSRPSAHRPIDSSRSRRSSQSTNDASFTSGSGLSPLVAMAAPTLEPPKPNSLEKGLFPLRPPASSNVVVIDDDIVNPGSLAPLPAGTSEFAVPSTSSGKEPEAIPIPFSGTKKELCEHILNSPQFSLPQMVKEELYRYACNPNDPAFQTPNPQSAFGNSPGTIYELKRLDNGLAEKNTGPGSMCLVVDRKSAKISLVFIADRLISELRRQRHMYSPLPVSENTPLGTRGGQSAESWDVFDSLLQSTQGKQTPLPLQKPPLLRYAINSLPSRSTTMASSSALPTPPISGRQSPTTNADTSHNGVTDSTTFQMAAGSSPHPQLPHAHHRASVATTTFGPNAPNFAKFSSVTTWTGLLSMIMSEIEAGPSSGPPDYIEFLKKVAAQCQTFEKQHDHVGMALQQSTGLLQKNKQLQQQLIQARQSNQQLQADLNQLRSLSNNPTLQQLQNEIQQLQQAMQPTQEALEREKDKCTRLETSLARSAQSRQLIESRMAQLQPRSNLLELENKRLVALGQQQTAQVGQLARRLEVETATKKRYEENNAKLQGQLELLKEQNKRLSEDLKQRKRLEATKNGTQLGVVTQGGNVQRPMEGVEHSEAQAIALETALATLQSNQSIPGLDHA